MRGLAAIVLATVAFTGIASADEERPSLRYAACRAESVDRQLQETCEAIDTIRSRLEDNSGNSRRLAQLQRLHSTALLFLGDTGDDVAMRDAVEAARAGQVFYNRARRPTSWAVLQVNVGRAQTALGARGDEAAAAEAVPTLQAALEALVRHEQPAFWAQTQSDLAEAFVVQGRGSDPDALRNAASALRAALEIYSRSGYAEERAEAEARLAEIYRALGGEPDPA